MGNNIFVPYNVKIPGKVNIGTDVLIQGQVKPNAQRFSINIKSDRRPQGNCLFHFNPRLDENTVVRNTFHNGIWGPEERNGGMVFYRNAAFEIQMLCSSIGYEVVVNGQHFCTYAHRLPYNDALFFTIHGDVNISLIQLPSGRGVPSAAASAMFNQYVMPYTEKIPGPVMVGTDINIKGLVKPNCHRFAIIIKAGPNEGQDILFVFNPRFDENVVVRNSFHNGKWGAEERDSGMVFYKNMEFDIHMIVTAAGYEVSVNGRYFCTFNHRLPSINAQYIKVQGGVQINHIQVPCRKEYPAEGDAGLSMFTTLSLPMIKPIPGGFAMGKLISMKGIPHASPGRITINLLCGPYEACDIAFCFDVRFNFGNDRNQIIRTHRQTGVFGPEERSISHFPFYPNSSFDIMFLCETTCIKVAVNGQHFLEFYHRLQPPHRADHLNVSGDCMLTQVQFQ